MADLFVVLSLLGFFALCFAYVRVCDWIIGPDSEALPVDEGTGTAVTDQPAR